MDINTFVSKVEEQYTEVSPGSFTPGTNFKDQGEWGSLTALMIVAMVDQEFDKRLTGEMIESSTTIENLYQHLDKQN
jgi:acyl carrier protein